LDGQHQEEYDGEKVREERVIPIHGSGLIMTAWIAEAGRFLAIRTDSLIRHVVMMDT
jgi:hypothetical protein